MADTPDAPVRRQTPADAAFAAARELGEIMLKQRIARRQAQRDARNERRRARYAANPPERSTPQASPTDLYDHRDEAGCLCHVVPVPPCSWCESGGLDADRA